MTDAEITLLPRPGSDTRMPYVRSRRTRATAGPGAAPSYSIGAAVGRLRYRPSPGAHHGPAPCRLCPCGGTAAHPRLCRALPGPGMQHPSSVRPVLPRAGRSTGRRVRRVGERGRLVSRRTTTRGRQAATPMSMEVGCRAGRMCN